MSAWCHWYLWKLNKSKIGRQYPMYVLSLAGSYISMSLATNSPVGLPLLPTFLLWVRSSWIGKRIPISLHSQNAVWTHEIKTINWSTLPTSHCSHNGKIAGVRVSMCRLGQLAWVQRFAIRFACFGPALPRMDPSRYPDSGAGRPGDLDDPVMKWRLTTILSTPTELHGRASYTIL